MKMSEIFDLPVTSDDLYEIFVHYGTAEDQDEAIANVINHADALADALESILEREKEMAYSAWDCKEDSALTFEDSSELAMFKHSFADELSALAAYRGAK